METGPAPSASRRRVLSDTLLILGAALLAVALAQLLGGTGSASGSGEPTIPGDSGITVGVIGPSVGPTLPPVPTLGQVVNPSDGFGASPTPVAFATLPPPTPSPSIEITPPPTATPAPTHRATPKPTTKPTPTPMPPPLAVFSCPASGTLAVSCDGSASQNATKWTWDWGDGSATDAFTTPTAGHTYVAPGCYTITLTVTGLNGIATNSDSHSVAVGPAGTC